MSGQQEQYWLVWDGEFWYHFRDSRQNLAPFDRVCYKQLQMHFGFSLDAVLEKKCGSMSPAWLTHIALERALTLG
ncbi:MAG: hypothetical protein COT39_02245 [Parcubacteria group bacterium CG08_land_8_20_14_0_20_48_21]|nr:MAG: hypothetical protein AUK21_01550 [Parcubacteria group bacterium CG2_30_48_51]PIS32886.1 MAG: hypothetical protein COT39_02245 [Parcubacteria group bacterium CG08_land_8_20_14_0_20_48_21]PIW78776.1 MAG: hypothetical protein COZ99_04505 [Parcubacteria group bacterium CG_4_8_14_3_um_filter_48_16]PIY78255.1 MAG: hypothetical protein COY83_00885 [Parcubacteria group bacterium CG_4_10_14_0_8_um_filter_48_154]PJC39710.1 MAG: hypothetical protein CO043_02830 [Parcubacteria group bacterium CG_4_